MSGTTNFLSKPYYVTPGALVLFKMEEEGEIDASESVRFVKIGTLEGEPSREGQSRDRILRRHAVYFLGDCFVFMFFIYYGRSGHGMSLAFGEILTSALPFVMGWMIAHYILGTDGAFGEMTQNSQLPLKEFFKAHTKSVLLGVPLGSIIFSLEREHIHILMWLITFFFLSLLLTAWRLIAFFVQSRFDPCEQ